MANKNILTLIGATVTASLCCVTPVLAVLAGSSSLASSFSWLSPYHNYLVAFTSVVLIYAWYDKLKPSKNIECDCDEVGFFSGKLFLALVTIFTAIMLSFPLWGNKFFDSAPTAQSCSSGACSSASPHPQEENTDTTKLSSLPVLKYLKIESNNPTPYKQVACTGTGYKVLDALMAQKKAEVEQMPPPVLLKMLDNDDDVTLLDIREPSHNDGNKIDAMDSYAITYGKLYFTAFKQLQNKNAVIVVYGKFGMVSLFVASTLQKLGYKHVYSLKGGFDAWKLAGYPYEKIE